MPRQDQQVKSLRKVRERTVLEIARLGRSLQAEIEPASAHDTDAAADVAADIYERGKTISLIRGLEAKLHSLDRAIEMASKGTYGVCEKCGTEIPQERLDIMPETTLCVHCAGKLEMGIRRSRVATGSRNRAGRFHDTESEEGSLADHEDIE